MNLDEKLPEAVLEAYIARRLREEAVSGALLAPEYVEGDTVAEVERSIEKAKCIYRRRQAYYDACNGQVPEPDAARAISFSN